MASDRAPSHPATGKKVIADSEGLICIDCNAKQSAVAEDYAEMLPLTPAEYHEH